MLSCQQLTAIPSSTYLILSKCCVGLGFVNVNYYSSGGREGHLMARLVWMPKVALGKILKCYIRAVFVYKSHFCACIHIAKQHTQNPVCHTSLCECVFNRADEVLGSYAALRFVRLLPAASKKNETIWYFFKYYDCTENLLSLVSSERPDTKMYNGP